MVNKKVFISYAHDDVDTVKTIYESLKKRKVDVWFDKVSLEPGKWKPQIKKIIPKCKYFVFCVSQTSLKRVKEGIGFLEEELQYAYEIAMDQTDSSFTIIPIRLEECDRGDLRLTTFQQYDLFPEENVKNVLDTLAVYFGGISLSDLVVEREQTNEEKLEMSILGKAEITFYAGDFEKTQILISTILDIYPNNNRALNLKGLVYAYMGQTEKAIEFYDKAINIDSKEFSHWYNKGNAFSILGKYENAIKSYKMAEKLNPNAYSIWYNLGVEYQRIEKYTKAIKAFEKAIFSDPDDNQAWNNKAICLFNLNKFSESIIAYNKAIKLHPDNYYGLVSIANAYKRKILDNGDLCIEKAINAYDRAIEFDKNRFEAWHFKGIFYYSIDNNKESLKCLIKARNIIEKNFGCNHPIYLGISKDIEITEIFLKKKNI